MTDGVEGDVVAIAHGDGCEDVVEVVGPDEVCLDLHPLAAVACVVVLFTPAELQEGCTGDDLAPDEDVGVVALAVIIDVGVLGVG